MIKRLMILSFFAMVIYNMTFAEDRLSISNIEITPGETIDVSISLENANPYVAFQFDLDLPNGISVFSVSANPDSDLNRQRARHVRIRLRRPL